ncbi:hypothetical protein [Robiginitalea biformata]|uniref:hypothetical protein n=1 Tax=Robiginitalea biformata TaxID=252307 RepID=UPI003B599650
MKGKTSFTDTEIAEISQLIEQKLLADSAEQKAIRAKIRRMGFYASDFGIGGGYTVQDFNRVISLRPESSVKGERVSNRKEKYQAKKQCKEAQRDEEYVLDLCDEVLGEKGLRQHRFDFLRGDAGTMLPVDAYYPRHNLVVEYRERQHSESVPFFDKRKTVSRVSRGLQRQKYDRLREEKIPENGIQLKILHFYDFQHDSSKRLLRNAKKDIEIISDALNEG